LPCRAKVCVWANASSVLPEPVWVSTKPGPLEPSLLYYRGLLYALMDNGVLVCLDGRTGREYYRQRLGGACNSSPVAGNGCVYASNNDGTTFVVRAGRDFRLVSTNWLGERITASPAISGSELLYRTDSHLYSISPPRGP
jgi:outer membrane protein assembly factor BamB